MDGPKSSRCADDDGFFPSPPIKVSLSSERNKRDNAVHTLPQSIRIAIETDWSIQRNVSTRQTSCETT